MDRRRKDGVASEQIDDHYDLSVLYQMFYLRWEGKRGVRDEKCRLNVRQQQQKPPRLTERCSCNTSVSYIVSHFFETKR